MFSSTSQMVLPFLWLLCAATLIPACMSHVNVNAVCNEKDQHMLSIFKQSIEDPVNSLSSWSTEKDCCKWSGVHCNNITGRVTSLQLDRAYADYNDRLGGKFNFSLLDLEFLSYLDLSFNAFEVIDFESILASSQNQSSHKVKFSNLLHLDLSFNYKLQMDNLRWVPHLSSLKYLNLNHIDLSNETLWLQRVTMLPSLMELRLYKCSLNGISSSLWYVNFTSLTLLDISYNNINSEMPKWLFNISNAISYLDFSHNDLRGQIPATMLNCKQLKYLDLGYNHLNGSIPKWIGQFKYLEYLDLSSNMLYGPIPTTIGNLSTLTYLNVGSNRLNGSVPMDLGQLSKLENLEIAYNSISGNLFEQSFTKLSNLKALELDSNDFIFDFGTHWNPPFQLKRISMSNCKVGPEFPSWIYTQRDLSSLDISSSGLSFNGDGKFWSFVTQIDELNLSNNSISGDLSTTLITSRVIDLHSNNLGGLLPRLSHEVWFFNIANNNFFGPIYTLLCQNITRKHALENLDMSHNLLSGELPDCWMHYPFLSELNLGNNNLTGTIPESMGSLINLRILRLRKNILYGNIPSSLESCKDLMYLDLAYNDFRGNIPSWINYGISFLLLRSNKFSGNIPYQLCQLPTLQVLDFANNRLFGPIPNCLSNITSMVIYPDFFGYWAFGTVYSAQYNADLPLIVKGQDIDYLRVSTVVHVIDLSSNVLSGSIPPELFSLAALQFLNLSHNHLTGKISDDIGHMRFLESLDLSHNFFSGEIPQSMSNLSFLSVLNLSYNNFNGRIPLGTQLQSFEPSSYIGNLQLCGSPLPNCTQEDKPNGLMEFKAHDDDDFKTSFQLGAGVGFASGFWGVCGTIFFIRKWRHAYFRTLENLHVIILIKVNHLLYGHQ